MEPTRGKVSHPKKEKEKQRCRSTKSITGIRITGLGSYMTQLVATLTLSLNKTKVKESDKVRREMIQSAQK